MSEELSQISPKSIGKFEFYKLGASTLNQLKDNNVFKQQVPEEFKRRKPDGLIINDKEIKGFVEYKQNKYLQTEEQISKIVSDWKEVAKSFCNLLIISSGIKTFWINTKNGKSIIGKDGSEINLLFDVKTIQNDSVTHEQTKLIEQIINQINNVITFDNNSLQSKNEANLIPLAKTMWQKLWVQSNNIPEKCLYNVVELFVFKFLSDLDVLNSHCNFQQVLSIRNNNCNESALNYYARNSRPEIQKLFPSGNDDTSIINGTVFVDENGDANKSYSQLFSELLDCLNEFENKQGSFRKIDHNFKTRLYELFLRQSAGVKRWGQYFTPRKVVKAMIKMINNTSFHENSRICDPFCGVGGFLLELIAEKSELRSQFNPLNGRVNPKIQLIGYDKGTDEKEDERTIILAKANMLIYFSDLISDYHDESFLKEFTNNAINKVFHLLRSNIGTFGKIDDEEYDLIITNPPYVTSGSKSLKDAIKSEGKQKFYEEVNGTGTESLAITWIIKKLKPNGQALVVVPDGLLKQISVLKYIRDRCFIKAIISLPQKTFYATSKKTYIMSLLKKRNLEQQTKPIFTYLVTETGESRDTYRFDIPKNDLTEMANLYNIYLNISQDDFKNLGGGWDKMQVNSV
ncbi:MAG: N-6 DNA methylase [Bdellovibrionaceae bacterium]|nr:N-6 DNA methylase [Pseudobdellovibrionaceae bacterium]